MWRKLNLPQFGMNFFAFPKCQGPYGDIDGGAGWGSRALVVSSPSWLSRRWPLSCLTLSRWLSRAAGLFSEGCGAVPQVAGIRFQTRCFMRLSRACLLRLVTQHPLLWTLAAHLGSLLGKKAWDLLVLDHTTLSRRRLFPLPGRSGCRPPFSGTPSFGGLFTSFPTIFPARAAFVILQGWDVELVVVENLCS